MKKRADNNSCKSEKSAGSPDSSMLAVDLFDI